MGTTNVSTQMLLNEILSTLINIYYCFQVVVGLKVSSDNFTICPQKGSGPRRRKKETEEERFLCRQPFRRIRLEVSEHLPTDALGEHSQLQWIEAFEAMLKGQRYRRLIRRTYFHCDCLKCFHSVVWRQLCSRPDLKLKESRIFQI